MKAPDYRVASLGKGGQMWKRHETAGARGNGWWKPERRWREVTRDEVSAVGEERRGTSPAQKAPSGT